MLFVTRPRLVANGLFPETAPKRRGIDKCGLLGSERRHFAGLGRSQDVSRQYASAPARQSRVALDLPEQSKLWLTILSHPLPAAFPKLAGGFEVALMCPSR